MFALHEKIAQRCDNKENLVFSGKSYLLKKVFQAKFALKELFCFMYFSWLSYLYSLFLSDEMRSIATL